MRSVALEMTQEAVTRTWRILSIHQDDNDYKTVVLVVLLPPPVPLMRAKR